MGDMGDETNVTTPEMRHEEIRNRLIAACDAMVDRGIKITTGDDWGVYVDEESGVPCVAGNRVTILGALVVAEYLQAPDVLTLAELAIQALGVGVRWLLWFEEKGEDVAPPAEYLAAYNLGRELRGRYVR